jgi:alpha-glucosidase
MLVLSRDLIALRKATTDLNVGAYAALPAPGGVWAWRRGDRHAVVVNCSDDDTTVDGMSGRVPIATDRARDGEQFHDALRLAPGDGCVVELHVHSDR